MIQNTLHQYYNRISSLNSNENIEIKSLIDLTSDNDITNILTHKNTILTSYSHKEKSFIHNGIKCNGMTYLTKKIFYNHHETSKNISTLKSRRSSKLKGTMIHRHIYHIIHCKSKCVCYPIKTRKLNKIAVDAISIMKRHGIKLIDAEIPIYSNILKSATSLDVIGSIIKDDIERPVVVSIKTGYNDVLFKDKTITNMDNPLTLIDNNPYNHHQLQALFERMILKKEYDITVDDFYILYLDHTSIGDHIMYKLENWCKNDSLCNQIVEIYNTKKTLYLKQ